MSLLGEVGKQVKEILDGYRFGKSLKVTTTNDAGLTVNVDGDLTSKGAQGSVTASLANTNNSSGGVWFNLDRLQVKTDGRVAGEASYILDSEVDSRLYVIAEDGRQEPGKPLKSFGKAGAKLATSALDVDCSVDVINGPTFRAAALYSHKRSNLSAGVEAQVNTHWEERNSGSELEDLNVSVAYSSAQWGLSARTTDRMGMLTLAYLHRVAPTVTLGTQLDYGLKSNTQRLVLGAKWAVDPNTTVRGKIDSSATLSAAFHHKLNEYAKLSVCASVDSRDLSNNDRCNFGLGLEFNS
jgi:hypothetical protein